MRGAAVDWARVRALFDTARALDGEERASVLAGCPDQVRNRVEVLLRAHDALEHPGHRGFLAGLDPVRAAALLEPVAGDSPDGDQLVPGDTLGRYRIEERLGRGGMGVVYRARDQRLDRPVALKLLSRHLALDAAARHRFAAEARAAGAIDHPNIATVYEIGEAPGDRLFIAMAYCPGESLRALLDRGPLPVRRAVAIATRVADALAAAHRRGIVHRDVKPGNVIVGPGDEARVVDFGVAKILGGAMTRTGETPGTVAYMSPEQTRRGGADPSIDVWGLGATTYEMLTGRRPFIADRDQAVIYSIRHDDPEPIGRLRPEVPDPVRQVVERCLRKDPAERYRDGEELLQALGALPSNPVHARPPTPRRRIIRRPFALVLASAAVVAGAILWPPGGLERTLWPSVPSIPDDVPRVAVLPFEVESVDPGSAHVGPAIVRELSASLGAMPGLRVVGRASVASLAEAAVDPAELSRKLGVGAVLRGRIERAGERFRIQIRLVDAATGEARWVRGYVAGMDELAIVLPRIAGDAARALGVRPDPGREPLREQDPEGPEAFDAYLKGRYYLGKLDARSFALARDQFYHALDRDPASGRAYAGLAEAYTQLASVAALPYQEAFPRARSAAEHALDLDEGLAEAHAALGTALTSYYWDSDGAERHFRRAIELDPSYAPAYRLLAKHLRNQGRFDEALAATRVAGELDPLAAYPRIEEGLTLYLAGRYDEAAGTFRDLLDAGSPDLLYAHFHLALVAARLGRYDEAIDHLDRVGPDGENAHTITLRGVVHAMAGHPTEARAALARLDADSSASGFQRAAILVHLGDHARALDLLEEAERLRTPALRILGVEPIFDPLRSEPRFRRLLSRVEAGGTERAAAEPRPPPETGPPR